MRRLLLGLVHTGTRWALAINNPRNDGASKHRPAWDLAAPEAADVNSSAKLQANISFMLLPCSQLDAPRQSLLDRLEHFTPSLVSSTRPIQFRPMDGGDVLVCTLNILPTIDV